MMVLLFKTNIQNQRMVDCLSPVFQNKEYIKEWSVDIEDNDHILRIVSEQLISEYEVIRMVNNIGIACEVLTD